MIFLAVVFGIASGLILERVRTHINMVEQRKINAALPALSFGGNRLLALAKSSAIDGLRDVSDARFSPKRLLSDNEAIVLTEVETIIAGIGQAWRVLAQVSLDHIVESTSAEAGAAIDGQQAALVVITGDRTPIAVIEYQPLGQVRNEDAIRDAVKREALRRASVAYIEVRASDQPGDLRDDLLALSARRRVAAPVEAAAPAADQAVATGPPRKPKGKPASGVKP
ncbi:MAG: DUF2726 domain-containing protein [Sandarakinorhabdus sp.]|nr:DUF2726 domain-containing protein [Sandarakinorhabdus sp.]